MSYFSLHGHSMFSILDGLNTPEEILDVCVEKGLRGFTITDHGTHLGHGYFCKLRKKWVAKICNTDEYKNKKQDTLGYFDTPEEASIAYKKARTTMAHRMKHRMMLEYGITDLRILDAIDRL